MLDNSNLEATISKTLANNDWRLTSSPEVGCDQQQFADRVRARLAIWVEEEEHTTITPDLTERAVKYEYCRILHQACSLRNSAAEERALEELWHWIYPYVRARISSEQDAEDVAQQALINIWQNCAQVRDQGAFLGYAYVVTIREVQQFYRRVGREPQFVRPQDEPSQNEDNEYGASLAAYEQALATDLLSKLILDETEREILRWLEECIPRSAARRLVIMEHVIRERSLAEVADLLNIKVSNVYVLKHRAIDSLKECVDLLRMLCQNLQPSVAQKILGK